MCLFDYLPTVMRLLSMWMSHELQRNSGSGKTVSADLFGIKTRQLRNQVPYMAATLHYIYL